MNKKLMALAAAAMSAVMALSGCKFVPSANDEGIASNAKSNEYDSKIVAEVNGQDITMADFNVLYYDMQASAQQYAYYYANSADWENTPYPGSEERYSGMTLGEYVRQYTIDTMSQFIVAQQKGKEYDILVDDDLISEADDLKKDMIESIENNGGTYQEYLDTYFISDYTIDKYLQRSLLVNKLYDRLTQEGELCYVSDDEVTDSFVKASHVLIMIDDDTTDEEALAKANEVVARLDAGDDMAQLIKEYGEDPGMEQQDYYVFTDGEMVTEFYEGALALNPNEYTKVPVKTSYGYHVIYRYPLTSADEGYEDVVSRMDDVRSQLANSKFTDALMGWIDTASTKIYDDVIDEALASQQEEIDKRQAEALAAAQSAYTDPAGGDAADIDAIVPTDPEE